MWLHLKPGSHLVCSEFIVSSKTRKAASLVWLIADVLSMATGATMLLRRRNPRRSPAG